MTKEHLSPQDIVCGLHSVAAALVRQAEAAAATSALPVKQLWVESGNPRVQQLVETAAALRITITQCARTTLDDLAAGMRHQGVVARLSEFEYTSETRLWQILQESESAPLVLVLDHIQDPHNLGACLRSAEAAGVNAVVLAKHGACGVNPTVRKVAVGATESVAIVRVSNLVRCMQKMQQLGLWLSGASETAQRSIYQLDLTAASAIVMGSEGQGLRRLLKQNCDQLGRIPLQGRVASLNVSVATGIVLFEALRQRRSAGLECA